MRPEPTDPPAIVRTAEDARQWLSTRWRAMEAREGQNLKSAREIGEFLAAQKELRPGRWLAWLKECAPFSQQRASEFMSIHDRWELVKDAGSIREALRVIHEDHGRDRHQPERFDGRLNDGLPAFGNDNHQNVAADDGPDDDYQREAQERTYDEHRPAFQERNGGTWAPEAAPARGKGDPSKLTDEKVIEWAKEHVPQPEPPVVGPDVGGFVGELIGHAERLRDGLIALRGRCGKGTPDWLDVCVAIERLQRFQADCSWRGKGRG